MIWHEPIDMPTSSATSLFVIRWSFITPYFYFVHIFIDFWRDGSTGAHEIKIFFNTPRIRQETSGTSIWNILIETTFENFAEHFHYIGLLSRKRIVLFSIFIIVLSPFSVLYNLPTSLHMTYIYEVCSK
jgi:hypothetical protein